MDETHLRCVRSCYVEFIAHDVEKNLWGIENIYVTTKNVSGH